jgi:mono/diheme cytochrome c family protein
MRRRIGVVLRRLPDAAGGLALEGSMAEARPGDCFSPVIIRRIEMSLPSQTPRRLSARRAVSVSALAGAACLALLLEGGRDNPIAATTQVLAEGRARYLEECASCHATDGSGVEGIGHRLPHLSDSAARLSDGELFFIIDGFRGKDPEETWKLVHYLRQLAG